MQVSKRWSDGGSNSVPLIDTKLVAFGSSVWEGQSVVTLTFERESQNPKRAEQYETERCRVHLTMEDAGKLIDGIHGQLDCLEYHRRFGRFPDWGERQAAAQQKPDDNHSRRDWMVFERMDQATKAAQDSDYIFAFESLATGYTYFAVTSDPAHALAHKKAVQMRGPQTPPSAS